MQTNALINSSQKNEELIANITNSISNSLIPVIEKSTNHIYQDISGQALFNILVKRGTNAPNAIDYPGYLAIKKYVQFFANDLINQYRPIVKQILANQRIQKRALNSIYVTRSLVRQWKNLVVKYNPNPVDEYAFNSLVKKSSMAIPDYMIKNGLKRPKLQRRAWSSAEGTNFLGQAFKKVTSIFSKKKNPIFNENRRTGPGVFRTKNSPHGWAELKMFMSKNWGTVASKAFDNPSMKALFKSLNKV